MAVHLASVIADIEQAVESPRPAEAAAKALEDTMRTGTARMIGADLRLSGFKGAPVKLDGESKPSLAFITLGGGTYALADKGRQQVRRYITPKRKSRAGKVRATKKRKGRKGHPAALMTPAGPRYRVRGSRSRPLRITDQYAPKALEAAVEAASKVIAADFAKAVG